MNCEEFLVQFREALEGKVSEQVIQDNINYYRSYIYGQVREGKSETAVLQMLGDPRLLAKTIEESSKFASESTQERRTHADDNVSYESAQDGAHYFNTEKIKKIKLPSWLITGVVVVIAVLMLVIAYRVFVFLSPVLLIFLLVFFVYRCVRDRFRKY